MKSNDRLIIMILPVVVALAGFYLLVISPKRSEISDLNGEAETARAALESAEGQVAAGEQARRGFSKNYAQIVKLGKAAPADGGQANLVYEFAELGKKNEVEFRSFTVGGEGGQATPTDAVASAPAAPAPGSEGTPPATGAEIPPAAGAQPAPGAQPADGAQPAPAPATPSPVAAEATEAVAASLPLGATVGPAGLPLVPYQFNFQGSFFDIGEFFSDIDGLVTTDKDGTPQVDGRLVTIDSFTLTADPDLGFPQLQADFDVTTYIVPPEQGLEAGVTPAGPAPGGLVSVPSVPGG